MESSMMQFKWKSYDEKKKESGTESIRFWPWRKTTYKQPRDIEFCKKWKFSEPAGLGPDAKKHQKGHREKLPPNQKEFFSKSA